MPIAIKDLAREALAAARRVRIKTKAPSDSPLCIFDLIEESYRDEVDLRVHGTERHGLYSMQPVVDDLFDVSGDSVVLRVHVQPGAGRTAVVGRHGNALKVRIAAPPEAGRANEACRALLAETFGVGAGGVELASGATSRMKRFRLDVDDLDAFRSRLEQVVTPDRPDRRGATGP